MSTNTNSWGAPGSSTSGYVLTSNGSSTAPTFQPGGGGGSGALTLLQTQSASIATTALTFTTGIGSNAYYLIQFFCNNSFVFSTVNFQMQWSLDGGSTYITSYGGGLFYTNFSSPSSINNSGAGAFIAGPSAGEAIQVGGTVTLIDLSYTGFNSAFYNGNFYSTTSSCTGMCSGRSAGITSPINAIQFSLTDGSTFTGVVSVYGYSS